MQLWEASSKNATVGSHPFIEVVLGFCSKGVFFKHLSKYVSRLLDAPLVRQHSPDPVCRPDVLVIVPQHRLVHRQRPVLVLLLLLLVFGRLVQGLQPHVPQSDVAEVRKVNAKVVNERSFYL